MKPPAPSAWPALVDAFGRVHTQLRVSVTDRCNLRCRYCMPEEVTFLPRPAILTFEEIGRVVRVAVGCGVRRVRITGGEPLLRRDLPRLVAILSELDGLDEIALTTNGLHLARHARALRKAGLDRLNVSLDTVARDAFRQLTRRDALPQVLEGIEAARAAGFEGIRINALAIRGFTEPHIVPLVAYCRTRGLTLRFIEFMPLDGERGWEPSQVLPEHEVRAIIESTFGRLEPLAGGDPHQPATDYRLPDGTVIGFIGTVTRPFCHRCNRLRITADGQVRNCLFARDGTDLRPLLRGGASDAQLAQVLAQCVASKKPGRGQDVPSLLVAPDRAMYEIGG